MGTFRSQPVHAGGDTIPKDCSHRTNLTFAEKSKVSVVSCSPKGLLVRWLSTVLKPAVCTHLHTLIKSEAIVYGTNNIKMPKTESPVLTMASVRC